MGDDNQLAKLVQHLCMPELAHDDRFETNKQSNTHREELRALLEEALATVVADTWFERFRAARIASAPVLTVGEGVEFADEIGLHPMVDAGDGEATVPTIKHPVDYSHTPARYAKVPPVLGAVRDAILTWITNRQAQGEHLNVASPR